MRLLCSVALLVLVAGCHDSSEPREITGTYPLRTYRDMPLPAVVSDDANGRVEIAAGTITLNGGLSFTDSYTFNSYNSSGVLTTTVIACAGTWTPTETSPQGGQLMTLVEVALPAGCGDRGTAEWDHNNKLTIAWNVLGLAQHRR